MVNLICQTDTHAVVAVTDSKAQYRIVQIGQDAVQPQQKPRFANFRELVELCVLLARSTEFDATELGLLPEELGAGAYRFLPLVGRIPEERHDQEWERLCQKCFPEFLNSDAPVRVRYPEIEIDDVKLMQRDDGSIELASAGTDPNPVWSGKGLALLWIFVLSDQRTEVATFTAMPNGQRYSPQYCPFLVKAIETWGVKVSYAHFPEPEVAITASSGAPVTPVKAAITEPRPDTAAAAKPSAQLPVQAAVSAPRIESQPGQLQTPAPQALATAPTPEQPWDVRVRIRCDQLLREL